MMSLNASGLILKTRHGRVLGALLLFLALATVSGIHRLCTESHYGRMFVRLDERLAGDESVTVFTRRADGLVTPLVRRDEDQRLFSRDSGWKKVRSIVITGDAVGPVKPEQLEVRVGPGWPHTTVLSVRAVRALPPDSAGLEAHRRRLQFGQAYEVTVDSAQTSIFSWNEGVINWQGDMQLVLHALAQGLFSALLLTGILSMLNRLGRLSAPGLSFRSGAMRLIAEVIRIFMLVPAVHLAWLWFWQLYGMRESEPFVLGFLAALGIAALLAYWFRVVARTTSERQLAIRMLFLTVLMASLKLFLLSFMEGIPRSDYARYYEYGKQLAAGDWESISNSFGPQSAIYLRRAAVCTFPVVACFGSSLSTFGIVNTVVQSLTAMMFSLLVWRMSGIRAAAYALPLLLISPEIWYPAGMITHNVFGYFWIVATWLVFDGYLMHAARQQQRGVKWPNLVIGALCWGIALGVGLSMIELTKGYGIMFELGLTVVVVFGPAVMKSLRADVAEGLPSLPVRCTLLLMAIATYRTLVPSVDSLLASRSGMELPRGWHLAVISAVESAGPGGGEALTVWLSRYHFQTPGKRVTPLVLRKILHEKLGEATELLKCILRKNELLASVVDSMGHSQDSVTPIEAGPRVENFRFGSLQFTLGTAIMLGLVTLFIGRLLMPEPSLSWSEVYPVTTTGLVMAVIYLAVESHPYYSANFVFPMCWSGGIVLDRLRRSAASAAIHLRFPALRLFSAGHLAAVATGIALLCVYCAVGRLVDQSGLTFCRIAAGEGSSKSGVAGDPEVRGLPENAASGVSRVHGWLEFRTESGVVRKGERISQRFVVQTGGGQLPGLSFFISGNQRARIHRINNNWKSLPFQYSVMIEGFNLVENRPLEELALPRFWSVPSRLWDPDGSDVARTVTVTVTLECTEDVAIGRLSPPPAVAIEYFH